VEGLLSHIRIMAVVMVSVSREMSDVCHGLLYGGRRMEHGQRAVGRLSWRVGCGLMFRASQIMVSKVEPATLLVSNLPAHIASLAIWIEERVITEEIISHHLAKFN
jgi:hypothetical protein